MSYGNSAPPRKIQVAIKEKKAARMSGFPSWPTRARTWNKGTKNLCVTITPSAIPVMWVQNYRVILYPPNTF